MPRRSGGGSRASAPSRVPARVAPRSHLPAPTQRQPSAMAQPQQSGMMAQPKQPSLMGQIATTAAGVAVGSVVGNTLSAAMAGGSSAPAEHVQPQAAYEQQAPANNNPCAFHLNEFVRCAQTQHDMTLCQGFNEALRECRISYGLPLQ